MRIGFFAIILVFYSCSSSKNISILVTKPAAVDVPAEVKKILLVNRSEGAAAAVIEGILSGESIGADRILSERCMAGAEQILATNGRFEVKRHDLRLRSNSISASSFGDLMSWKEVEELANQYGVDAVLTLEYFDSDFRLRQVRPSTTSTPPRVSLQANARIFGGFRMYLPKQRKVIYERGLNRSRTYTESSTSYLLAAARMIGGVDALKGLSFVLGQNLGSSLTVHERWVGRYLYKGRNSMDRQAYRNAMVRNWDDALKMWERSYDADRNDWKIAHNIALAHEVFNRFELAKEWATKAYVSSGKRREMQYGYLIDDRMVDERILEQRKLD